MSEIAKLLFDGLKTATKTAQNTLTTTVQKMSSDIGAEVKRLGKQGAMELAAALFNDKAFVPYGPGAYANAPENQKKGMEPKQAERGGMER